MKTTVLSLITVLACLTPALRSQIILSTSAFYRSLKQVSVAGDGIMYGLTHDGQIYGWTGKTWALLDGELAQISVGSKTEIWGVNSSNQVWKASAVGWVRQPGLMRQVAIAKGGGSVVAIDLAGKPFIWNGGGWTAFPNAPVLKQIAVGRPGQIYGIGTEEEIYRWRSNLNRWVRLKGALKTISVGTDGSIGGVNSENMGWARQDADVESELNGSTDEPKWTRLETTVGAMEIIDVDTSMLLDSQGLLVQRGVPWSSGSDPGVLILDSELVISTNTFYDELKIVLGPTGGQPYITPGGCVILSGHLTLDIPGAQPIDNSIADGYVCKKAEFRNVAAVPQIPNAQNAAIKVTVWFQIANATSSKSNQASASDSPSATGLADNSLFWVAREKKSMTQNGP